ncbi:MAG: hypothetical protein GY756_21085 [bacterium]|nr:hypothetical protein [bacterium]
MHKPYSKIRGYAPDFKIKYHFYSLEEEGRKNPVFQGIRSDFSYDGDDIQNTGIYMIHPEFIDKNGDVIVEDNIPISNKGYAYMWILIPEMRKRVHQKRIRVGVKGYFQEGGNRTGRLEVVEVIGLHKNPIE